MLCPKCTTPVQLKVVNTYRASGHGQTQRLECPCCRVTVTAVSILLAVEPGYGEGAKSIADQIAEQNTYNSVKTEIAALLGIKSSSTPTQRAAAS